MTRPVSCQGAVRRHLVGSDPTRALWTCQRGYSCVDYVTTTWKSGGGEFILISGYDCHHSRFRVGSATRNKYINAPPPLRHVNVTRSTCAASLPHVQNARDRFHSPSWRQTRPPQGLDVTLGHCGFAGCRQTRTMVAESARCHRPLLGRHSPHPGRAGTPWGASPGASIGGCHTCLGGPHMFKCYI